jgi:N-acetylmuramoyl-L-alanine amidase
VQINRLIINPGHGLSNAKPGVYDPGASSAFGEEHNIVQTIASALPALVAPLPCILTPVGISLGAVIQFVNGMYQIGDLLISVHMNEGGGSGTRVLVADAASEDEDDIADALCTEVSYILEIPNGGVIHERDTPRYKEGIVRNTKPRAFLIELGFIDKESDVAAVKARGAQAVAAGIKAISTEG